MVFWWRQAGVVLVFGIAVFLFAGVRETPDKLLTMAQDFWPRRDALRREWRAERAGEVVLPLKVQAMLALLRENQVRSFRYSQRIANDADTSVVQRIAESAYPIRLSQQAQHLLALAGEPLEPSCKPIAQRQEVVLASCS